MRPNKARFITACQQVLAIGAVVAVLAPAANVVSLDVVPTRPGAQAQDSGQRHSENQTQAGADKAAEGNRDAQPIAADEPTDERGDETGQESSGQESAEVETAPVDPVIKEVALTTAPRAARSQTQQRVAPDADTDTDEGDDRGSDADTTGESTVITSDIEDVTGYGAVGVTWDGDGAQVEDDEVTVNVRTRTGADWGSWSKVEYHDEHGADAEEGDDTRPGTDALFVGEVDQVQAKVTFAAGVAVPQDIKLAVISPGTGQTEVEAPAIDTSAEEGAEEGSENAGLGDGDQVIDSDDGKIALQAATKVTSKPKIYSRAQWGANENLRDKGSLRYYEIHAGFVHHTVNANNYSRAQVPGIIRSIYAYHTRSRGWSDVGYNFLVDRFGRIWEGRYGGVDRPVVGAHTLGYNDYSFAMSAIGNFETAKPSAALIDAYARLMAWKLSLHGVDAASTSQRVGSRTFQAINGHRDAGSTACPGRYLYAKIPTIRSKAAQYQADWSGRSLATDLVGSAHPDILLRRSSDKVGFALPTLGMLKWAKAKTVSTGWSRYDAIVASPDLTGDGKADLLVRTKATGDIAIRPGDGNGSFGAEVKPKATVAKAMRGFDQITAVGNFNNSSGNDVVARQPATGKLFLFRGNGKGSFSRVLLSTGWKGYDLTVAAGDANRDGRLDLYARDRSGVLWFHPGTGANRLQQRVKVSRGWDAMDAVTGIGDFTGDGIPDVYARQKGNGMGLVFPGNGNGRFAHRQGPFGKVNGRTRISAANVIGTASPDLVALAGDKLVVIRHQGSQNVGKPVNLGTRGFAKANAVLNVGDWDRDGHGDFVVRASGNGSLYLVRGLGNNKFAAPAKIGTGWADVGLLAAVGDTTGDGYPDLMGQPAGKAMRIYPGRSNGFKASYVARSRLNASRQLGIGRWDDDGAPDNVLRVGDKLVKYAGNGPGGLTGSAVSLSSASLKPYDWVISAGDVDRNGRPDLVVRKKSDGTLWLLSGTKTGFKAPKFLAAGFSGYDLAG